jgi:hypothetical protein
VGRPAQAWEGGPGGPAVASAGALASLGRELGSVRRPDLAGRRSRERQDSAGRRSHERPDLAGRRSRERPDLAGRRVARPSETLEVSVEFCQRARSLSGPGRSRREGPWAPSPGARWVRPAAGARAWGPRGPVAPLGPPVGPEGAVWRRDFSGERGLQPSRPGERRDGPTLEPLSIVAWGLSGEAAPV